MLPEKPLRRILITKTMAVKPLSVSQLNNYISRILRSDSLLSSVPVTGEIDECKYNSKGYITFTLKDSECSMRCYVNAFLASTLRFILADGMQIVVYASINVYEKNAGLSLNVNAIEPAGEGTLAAAFRLLNEKLEKEGLFDASRKRKIPSFPKKIGVVTSRNGSAVHDIVDTTRRRNTLVDIIIYPALVQGEGSAASVCEGIRFLNENYPDLDVIIVGRGGGSADDLWTFNEESVARAIYASAIPIVSAVGHHDNHSISDKVADLEAGTPTAAAELVVPDLESLKNRMSVCSPENSYHILASRTESARTCIIGLKDAACNSIYSMLSEYSSTLKALKLSLDGLYPLEVLKKGYAAIKDENGKWLAQAKEIQPGDKLNIVFSDGYVQAEAIKVIQDEKE